MQIPDYKELIKGGTKKIKEVQSAPILINY
jgi:hypothetical protein